MVKAADIMDIATACETESAFGLFIHTGRTPPAACAIARESRVVDVLSGDRLMTFFAGDKLRLRFGLGSAPASQQMPQVEVANG